MRSSFLVFMLLALLASTVSAASAFNWAQTGARTVEAAIVDDNSAYLAIDEVNYGCYVDFSATTGKVDVNFDGGTSCGGTAGSGINAGAVYYFHDVLKVTNKGTVTLTNLWFNMTGTDITLQTATSQGSMTTSGTYASSSTATNLAVGSSMYVGFKVSAAAKDKSNSPLTGSFTVDARSST